MKKSLFILIVLSLMASTTAQDSKQQQVIQQLEQLHAFIEHSPVAHLETEYLKTMQATGLPTSTFNLPDGAYRGETPADDFGYRHVIQFEVTNGKLGQLDYDEIHADGHTKEGDEQYGEKMSASGTTPAIAYPIYENTLMEQQNLEELDAVSGASYSLYRFKLAVAYAIATH